LTRKEAAISANLPVATSLDEEAADAAFVRFITDRNAAMLRDRSKPS
jgi:hypothetical protein